MKQIWFTSDPHAYHKNICKGTSEWDINGGEQQRVRDFINPEQMTEEIVKAWNKHVQWDDELWCLGDWSFGGFNNIKKFRDQINCRNIHLILGNHDHHIENNKENIRDLFSSVQYYKELSLHGHKVVLLHYGMRVWNKSHKGAIHLFGHSHNTLPPHGKSMDVGVDCAFERFGVYRPFSWMEIQSIMSKRESEIVDHHNSRTS